MSSNEIILTTCLVFYLISGGRWTVVLFTIVLTYILKQTRMQRETPPTKSSKSKSSPIYAVDFTTSAPAKPKSTIRSRGKRTPKVIQKKQRPSTPTLTKSIDLSLSNIYIFYSTLTGSSKRIAEKLHSTLSTSKNSKLLSLDDDVDDLEEYFLKCPENAIYLLVIPSYETDSPIDYFIDHLIDVAQDFRIDKYPLSKLIGFSVLGVGDSESWNDKFCYQGKLIDKWMGKLGGRRIYPFGEVCVKTSYEKSESWISGLHQSFNDNEAFYIDEVDSDLDSDSDESNSDETLVDVEELGKGMRNESSKEVKEMVAKDSPTFKSLTKQGYTIVGSHSGVKICRWTKSALRGRGSCYKFAFYGIKSHLCMETTPSLACSNKCVFCWRHGTNPVAKSQWRWALDPPEKILNGALAGHYQKIKQLRGVPGIQMDRFNEAFKVRHCALSLVGEPIFYPHINEFVKMLHDLHISSFLVCNAQHPDALAKLSKVTQLYVSIDAPTKTDLKKVDRPLNSDFWERLISCLDILRTTQSHQRTVFRLTLVKGFNMSDIEAYADMVERARPSQIEIKGATFCGTSASGGNPLTMQNIPFYEECKEFVISIVDELKRRNLGYDIAAEHAHSCCILIADEKFKINGKWFTHIDYPKFFELLESGQEFNDLDYVKETPEWAIWGSTEGGFNPKDTRFIRKKKGNKTQDS
ncbi:unnamed protein product [Candida verbasci]|uniref:S-adenosyl-L-methionine-dependent tRNA 4-demethylwyosine synthase n=1 Tax=Candida verbasci TaxID=1227364 RepID=A0A9W4U0M8_9ASCO|nr:unnamed protein product [Candida verbasci]